MASFRVLHVAHGIEQEQTGAGYAVSSLCCSLAEQGIEVTLASLNLGGTVIPSVCETKGLKVERFPFTGPRRIGYSPQLRSFMKDAIEGNDLVQTHFLWSSPVAIASRLALTHRKPLIVMPRGALFPQALSKSRFSKRMWYRWIDGPMLDKADCVVATSEGERECIDALVNPRRLTTIPDAIEMPELPDGSEAKKAALRFLGNPAIQNYVLYLGTLSRHKNIEKLIEAWAALHQQWNHHTLVLVGPGSPDYVRRLGSLVGRLGLTDRAIICAPVYGSMKWSLLQGAEAVVLPSRSENFGLVLMEALYCGTPVVASRGYPWPWVESEGFGHRVEMEDGLLEKSIHDVLSWLPERRQRVGERAHEFIRARFSRITVARQFIDLYQKLLS